LKLDIGSKDSCLLYEWLEERLEIQSLADDVLSKYIPTHVNLFYCFGGLIVSAFVFQVSSGLALTIYYRASILDAFDSVKLIMIQIHLGWFIHSIHRWFASNLVIFLFLHISRVFLTGSISKPRELVWLTGILVSLSMISFGVTGYSLSWDQISFWATKIVTSIPYSLDAVFSSLGSIIVYTFRGNFGIDQATLTRMYTIHTFVLPAFIIILLVIHFSMIRKTGISGPI